MDALMTWLREQIAEDREIATMTALRPEPATLQWFTDGMQVRDGKDHLIVQHSWVNEIAHIVRHDPRAVLALCDAHNALLNLVESGMAPYDVVLMVALAYRDRPGIHNLDGAAN